MKNIFIGKRGNGLALLQKSLLSCGHLSITWYLILQYSYNGLRGLPVDIIKVATHIMTTRGANIFKSYPGHWVFPPVRILLKTVYIDFVPVYNKFVIITRRLSM